MVAQHYRWDFYGLSTDTKPDATNPRVADGSTYYEADTSKLYVWYNDQWYEKQSTGGGGGGEAGAFKLLTPDDYNFPEANPDGVAPWLLPAGLYLTTWGTHFYFNKNNKWNYNLTYIIMVGPQKSEDGSSRRVYFFGGNTADSNYFQDVSNGGDAGRNYFNTTSA